MNHKPNYVFVNNFWLSTNWQNGSLFLTYWNFLHFYTFQGDYYDYFFVANHAKINLQARTKLEIFRKTSWKKVWLQQKSIWPCATLISRRRPSEKGRITMKGSVLHVILSGRQESSKAKHAKYDNLVVYRQAPSRQTRHCFATPDRRFVPQKIMILPPFFTRNNQYYNQWLSISS